MKFNIVRLFFWLSVILVIVVTGYMVCQSPGNWLLTIAVLLIAAWTLDATILRPPSIWIANPDELGLSDLIFFLYNQDGIDVPRDYLLQMHALIGNTGGKQAVITRAKVVGFKTKEGKKFCLSERPVDVGGHIYTTWISYQNAGNGANFDRRLDPPPFILPPHDVLIIRFRYRGGIDWSNRWTLEALKSFYDGIAIAPEFATIEITFRWGKNKKTVKKDVAIDVDQHQEYTSKLRSITSDFTHMPNVQEQGITD